MERGPRLGRQLDPKTTTNCIGRRVTRGAGGEEDDKPKLVLRLLSFINSPALQQHRCYAFVCGHI